MEHYLKMRLSSSLITIVKLGTEFCHGREGDGFLKNKCIKIVLLQ